MLKVDRARSFVQRARAVHRDRYTYEQFIYVNNKVKGLITCRKHGTFPQRASNHLKGHGCPACNNERKSKEQGLGTEEFIKRARLVHGNKYSYDKVNYTTNCVKVVITCPVHGDFNQQPAKHLLGMGCRPCGGRIVSDLETFIVKATDIHKGKYSYDRFVYTETRATGIITCPTHGDFEQNINSHIKGYGCSKCVHDVQRKSTADFIKEASALHSGRYSYESFFYTGKGMKGVITCPRHGDFEQSPNNHLKGAGCPRCSKNGISDMSQQWLDSLGIAKENRERWVRVGSKKYRVDALDALTNTVYEFDGDFWHGNPALYDPLRTNDVNHLTFGALYRATLSRKACLEREGFTVVSVWASEWKKHLENRDVTGTRSGRSANEE